MFNIYQFEKQAKQDAALSEKWAKDAKTQGAKRRSSSNAARERLVSNYRSRVTSFIKDMTVKPVAETDYYGKGFRELSHTAKMVGPPRMNFGAPRVDNDRIKTAA